MQSYLSIPRSDRVPVLVGRRVIVGLALPYALDAMRNSRMCEIGVKENSWLRALTERKLLLNNLSVGFEG